MTIWKRLVLVPALLLTIFVASSGDWPIVVGAGLTLGILQFLRSKTAVSLLDLFDRSTVSFGAAAGVPFGLYVAKSVGNGESILSAISHGLLGPAGAAFLIVFAISVWVRVQLIRQSLRKGYLS